MCPSPEDTDDPAIRAIRSLRPLQMDVIALRVVAGLTEEDTALVVGRPVERVRAVSRAGLNRLLGAERRDERAPAGRRVGRARRGTRGEDGPGLRGAG
ncbi:MAG: sigma factor-like helix-turn-helix DNA-binding protein [Acidimicrobiales bacterium]